MNYEDTPNLGVACGNCGGNVYMVTCNDFRGTGHEWVLASICMICRAVHWTDDGCRDCLAEPPRRDSRPGHMDRSYGYGF